MVDLLKSGTINNRLLCEIATGCFNNLNTSLENVRAEIISQNPDIEEDVPLKTLLAAQISEEDFFCHIAHKTWDNILKEFLKAKRNLSENCFKNPQQSKIRVSALEKDNLIILFSSYLILIIVDRLDILYFYI